MLKLPKGYKGFVVSSTDRILPKTTQPDEEEDEEEKEEDVKVLEEQATFDELMVWGHEAVFDGGSDPYVRGVEEWIGFAEQVRGSRSREIVGTRVGDVLTNGGRFTHTRKLQQRRKGNRGR